MTSTIEGTLDHALCFAQRLNNCDLSCAVVAALIDLGVATHRIGFEYLKHAILMYCDEPSQMITKTIYPAVGRRYEPRAGKFQVEQAIRSVIHDAWENRDEAVWRCYFPSNREGFVEKPSNGEFISRVARFLELWQGCCKGVNYESE